MGGHARHYIYITDRRIDRAYRKAVTRGLERFYGKHDLHFTTFSCYRRQPQLGTAERRDLLARVLEQARRRYRFVVAGYVFMPEHVHLLITEPEVGDPSVVMKVIKERFTRLLRHGHTHVAPLWQRRFYDFNLWTSAKRVEKLRYIHRNPGVPDERRRCARWGDSPVKRGLVQRPEDWSWSSYRSYACGGQGLVRVNCQEWPLQLTSTHSFQNRE